MKRKWFGILLRYSRGDFVVNLSSWLAISIDFNSIQPSGPANFGGVDPTLVGTLGPSANMTNTPSAKPRHHQLGDVANRPAASSRGDKRRRSEPETTAAPLTGFATFRDSGTKVISNSAHIT